MPSLRSPQEQLRSVAAERGLVLSTEIFESITPEWIEENLGPTTLLSKEEVELQAKLEANGTARKLAANHDLSHVRPLLDEDLRTAIRSLETSTSAIEKQTAQLKQQWQYLETHGHELGKLQALQKKTTEKLERNSTLEEQHVRIASEELIQDISAKLSSYQSGVQSRSKVAPTKISELLNHDDRILSKISKVATSLTPDDGSHEEASLRTDSLASTLAHFRTKTLQCRLDRLYLETLHEEFASRPAEEENLAETELQQKSLEEELDSLYPEIHDLASMSVEQEFKAPIMSTLAAQSRMRHEMSEGQRRYILETLTMLTSNLSTTTERLEPHHAYHIALETLADSLPRLIELTPRKRSKSTAAAVPPSTRTLSSSDTTSTTTPSLDALLRHLGLPPSSDPSLLAALDSKVSHLRTSSSSEDFTTSTIATVLDPYDLANQMLTEALHADSLTGRPSLTDEETERRMQELEGQIARLGKGIEGVDLVGALEGRENKKMVEGFLERWG